MREEVKALLKERDYDLPKEMESQEFNQTLAYLGDIFTGKSVSMQGKNINILKCREKLNAFKEKLYLWWRRVKRSNLSNFSSLEEIVDDDESLIPYVCEESVDHLEIPSKLFDRYFGGGLMLRRIFFYFKFTVY